MYQHRIHGFAYYVIFFVLLGIVVSGGIERCAAQNSEPVDGNKNVLILYGERLNLPTVAGGSAGYFRKTDAGSRGDRGNPSSQQNNLISAISL